MKNKHRIITASLCFGLLLIAAAIAAPVFATDTPRPTPAPASTATLRNVWVFFKDKGDSRSAPAVSPRAELRRRKAGFRDSESDRPINSDYILEVERRGGALRTVFPWGNAASFSIDPSRLPEISSLPFVKAVSPVGVYVNRKIGDGASVGLSKSTYAASKSAATAASGGYDWHTEMVNVPLAHDYIRYKGLGAPGSGVIMAFFDGGFRLDHAAYKRLRDSSQVIAAYDFVDKDTLVADPAWVANNPLSPYYQNDRHGSQTLSFAAAYVPGVYIGTAYGASFALARTEDDSTFIDSAKCKKGEVCHFESHTEEENWLEAMWWADSVGAQIISSSLGYRDGYTDSTDYAYTHMDGETTIISIAAAKAVERGMIVVNAMGNEGSDASGTLTAPADVASVVSVGAVTQNRTIAGFSSTGPTYDGRVKPDVVAPGVLVPVPDPYLIDRASYTLVNGTSFSTPIVSAIMALILQAHPDISPQAAQERLYASCGFALGQTVADNKFGRGIPNAALAVMDTNEIFLKITDADRRPLAGAAAELIITDAAKNTLTSETALDNWLWQQFTIDSAGGVFVKWRRTYTADTAGNVLIQIQKSVLPAQIRVSYRDNQYAGVSVGTLPLARIVELSGKSEDGLRVAPNITRKNGVIRGRYAFTGAGASTPITATVRTLTGKKVWKQKLRLRPDGTADFEWNVKNGGKGGTAAGVYLVVVQCGYSVICERVVVSN